MRCPCVGIRQLCPIMRWFNIISVFIDFLNCCQTRMGFLFCFISRNFVLCWTVIFPDIVLSSFFTSILFLCLLGIVFYFSFENISDNAVLFTGFPAKSFPCILQCIPLSRPYLRRHSKDLDPSPPEIFKSKTKIIIF